MTRIWMDMEKVNTIQYESTGIILAGGKNNRLPGKKKGFRKVGGRPILDHTLSLFKRLFSEVILVVNDPKDFCQADCMVVTDIDPSGCALAGLYTGLFYASHPWSCVTACDVPFVSEKVIRHLMARRARKKEIIIPRTREGVEPLCALYHKTSMAKMKENLAAKKFMIKKSFREKKVLEIPPEELERLDPDMRFKFNVNTPQDLETARAMARIR